MAMEVELDFGPLGMSLSSTLGKECLGPAPSRSGSPKRAHELHMKAMVSDILEDPTRSSKTDKKVA